MKKSNPDDHVHHWPVTTSLVSAAVTDAKTPLASRSAEVAHVQSKIDMAASPSTVVLSNSIGSVPESGSKRQTSPASPPSPHGQVQRIACAKHNSDVFPSHRKDGKSGVSTDVCNPKYPISMGICVGSAGLTRALIKAGMNGIAVDHAKNRHRPKAKITILDLTTVNGGHAL